MSLALRLKRDLGNVTVVEFLNGQNPHVIIRGWAGSPYYAHVPIFIPSENGYEVLVKYAKSHIQKLRSRYPRLPMEILLFVCGELNKEHGVGVLLVSDPWCLALSELEDLEIHLALK